MSYMKLAKEREHIQNIGIINTHDQCVMAGGDRIVITKRNQDVGRGGHCAAWQIIRWVDGEQVVTDKATGWYNYGHKTFLIGCREDIKPVFHVALMWVIEQYGKSDFVKNRLGDYIEREVNEKFPIPKRPRKGDQQ